MAAIDARNDTLVIRIVYDGPPTSGKTTTLRALAGKLAQGAVFTPEERAGRTLWFDWLDYVGGRFEGRQIHCQIISVPGQQALRERRRVLLESADAVVFVADSSPDGIGESLRGLERLGGFLEPNPRGVVVQVNKRDVPGAASLDRFRVGHSFAVTESIASSGEGVRESFVLAVRLALDHVRTLSEVPAVDSVNDHASELLKQLRGQQVDAPLELLEELESAPRDVRAVRLPDADLPSGTIWPPIQGRVLLQEATVAGFRTLRELGPGEWLAESEGWRFHSSTDHHFDDLDSARTALINWAQVHTSCSGWISPSRCIALTHDDDGSFRLWQVVRSERSLWTDVSQSPANADVVEKVAAACESAADRWTHAPFELPCTLETIGVVDGVATFISLMPEPSVPRAPRLMDLHGRLKTQLKALMHAAPRSS